MGDDPQAGGGDPRGTRGSRQRLLPDDLRREAYHLLDSGTNRPSGILLQRVIIALILVSVGASVLESVPSLGARFEPAFRAVEYVTIAAFTLELAARLWSVAEHPPYAELPRWRARLRYLATADFLIDLVAIVPFYLNFLNVVDVRALLALRLLRFLKLTRYSPGMRSLAEAIHGERAALVTCLMFLVGVALIGAAFMHWAEREAQPDRFGTIPDALYWAMITLTTVGYGDVVPVTPLGKAIATVTALLGLVMLALPIGIIATAFAQVIQRRDFVVTWSMVARVPLFSALPAAEIAEVMRYLASISVEPGEIVVRKGDVGQSMYLIASGQVAVELPGGPVRLGEGQFFGEIALLRQTARGATVRAMTRCKLLVLDAADLRSLSERRPDIAEALERVARERTPEKPPLPPPDGG